MRAKFSAFFSFLLIIAAVIVVLKTMNWLPLMLQKDTIRRYNSIEEVKTTLNIRDIYAPSYFPQNITWPPSEILAQTKPFPAIFMKFTRSEKRDVALVISQAASKTFTPDAVMIFRVKETVPYLLKGRHAALEVGLCKNEEPCGRLSWDEGAYRITISMKSTPFELIKIAESMIH